jgi:hypothetical protein
MSIDSLPSRRGGDRYSSANEGQMFLVVRKGCMGLRQFGPAWGALLSAGRHCEDVEARLVPPTGVEPAHMASEANALSAELRGQCFANIGSWCPVLPGRSRLAQEECRIIWKRPQFAQQPLFLSVGECAAIVFTDVEVGVGSPPKRVAVVQGRFSSGHQQFEQQVRWSPGGRWRPTPPWCRSPGTI